MKIERKKIIVGLSGGVDSAVCAWLLKQKGHDVSAIYMQNWEVENDDPHCSAHQDQKDAATVAQQIGIPFTTVNFAKEYWQHVFQHCLDEFANGRTPNPDIWCNKEIKFKIFLNHALSLGADFLATGHYARKAYANNQHQLLKASDANKDQTYFLYTLGQKELHHALFALGELTKNEVRKIAKENGFINYAKKDSTGICFIGERKFKAFLSEFFLTKKGNIETAEGKTIGQHDGLMFYTIGQRKGLNIGGRKDANDEPWYVLSKDLKRNVLIIGQGEHPLLYSDGLLCTELHWTVGFAPKTPLSCYAKTRYRQPEQACKVEKISDKYYRINFMQPQRAITPGQSIVFYLNEQCLGGGIITESIRNKEIKDGPTK